MSSYLSSLSSSPPPMMLVGAGIAIILGAATIAFISSRTNTTNSPAALQKQKVHDPYYSTALMANGSFGKEETYDTVINCAVRFDAPVDKDTLIELFKKHIIPHQQFHCIPKTVPAKSTNIVWEPLSGSDGKLDVSKHFVEHQTSDAGESIALLEKICGDSTLLRRENLPWWRVHLIYEGADNNNKGMMMVISTHHCLGDGVSLLSVFSKIITSDAEGKVPLDMSSVFAPTGRSDPLGGDRGIVANILQPWRWPTAILETLDFFYCAVVTMLHPLKAGDTTTCFTQQPWPHKNDMVMIPMGKHSLDLIKKIKNAAGKRVTVNDVEYALYAGMMRRYLIKYGGVSASQIANGQFRGMTPFAIPHPVPAGKELTHTMANTFTFLVNDLPIKQRTARDRLLASHRSWQSVKHRSFVPAAFSVTRLASVLPLAMQQQTIVDLLSKCTVVFSNVPGPATDMYIAGSKITEIHALYSNLIPQVIIISANGEMHYSLMTKRFGHEGKESDCKIALPKLFQEELDEMCSQFNVVVAAK